MSAAQVEAKAIYCDGCSLEASPEHLRSRIERLEWASRFRPIRIETLFMMPAPPAAMEDFFYFPNGQPENIEARALQEDILEAAGIAAGQQGGREGQLKEFQQSGYFMTSCVECPIPFLKGEEFDALLQRMMPTLDRRIRLSYRPKAIILISEGLTSVARFLKESRPEPLLLMRGDRPVSLPKAAETASRERFRAEISSLLAES